MAHSLLHQVLVSDLVVPVMMAEAPEHMSRTRYGARLGAGTWLCPDLVVARREQFPADRPYVTGTPLLVVEIASPASLERDFGARRALWARYGLPSYWVVRPEGDQMWLHVFDRDEDGDLVERTCLSREDSHWVTDPFKIQLRPAELFGALPRTLVEQWKVTMPKPNGPDLPPADQAILVDAFGARWPTGAEKTELEDGCPVFYGTWDGRDVEIAECAYPGRPVRLDQPPGEPGTMRVLPSPRGVPADEQDTAAAPRPRRGRSRSGTQAQDAAPLIKINLSGDLPDAG